jgi:ergothioneine biosynthesis protein EgtB
VSAQGTIGTSPTALGERYLRVRSLTETLAAPLEPEDQVVQSMADVSPTKWHRAHVTWFFETFLLLPHAPGYRPYHDRYGYLFNSYYQQVGERHPRPQRGLLSRPTVAEVGTYRAHVDAAMVDLLDTAGDDPELAALVDLGLHHEQQHQELLLMDIKHVFSVNPLRPSYRPALGTAGGPPAPTGWLSHGGGLVEVGKPVGIPGFAFDNESDRHQVHLRPFEIADRAVTNAEWLAFIDDGGYRRPELWLSDGWATVLAEGWEAPL